MLYFTRLFNGCYFAELSVAAEVMWQQMKWEDCKWWIIKNLEWDNCDKFHGTSFGKVTEAMENLSSG